MRLPDPSDDEIALSRELGVLIAAEIALADGFLPFDRFMDLALYAPAFGYYVAAAPKFGIHGDFVTAPEISPLYGACLANQCAVALTALGDGIIMEFGGGSGRMAASILTTLRERGIWPIDYVIIELSPILRERQRQYLNATVPELAGRVQWWQAQPASPQRGVVIANEVIDALPVTLFERSGAGIHERGVDGGSGRELQWAKRAGSDTLCRAVTACFDSHSALSGLYRSEINLRQAIWLADLTRFITRGVVLVADYGYPRSEYYHPDRNAGTLQCHYRHRVHNDVFWYPGLQDITASVDFSALADAAADAGFEVRGFADQANFLLSNGITERLAELSGADQGTQYRATQAVKTLLLPQAMGTRAKFMSLSLNYDGPITGYELRDERHRL